MSDDLTCAYLLGHYDASKEWRDVSEFEARVAAKLTDVDYSGYGTLCETCTFDGEDCIESYKAKYHHKCTSKWAILKRARLDVEEEMDNEK